MAKHDHDDPISSELSEFIDFFKTSLGDLTFPDVDAAALENLAQTVRDRSSELARLDEQMRLARAALDEARAALQKASQRGLAYARVYVDGNDELSTALDNLSITRPEAPSKPRKRKPKSKAKNKAKSESTDEPTGELPFVAPASEAA